MLSPRSISMTKGKGSLRHNNRLFVSDNVDVNRIKDNITLVRQSLKEAYDECFWQSVAEYNTKQKRKDRKINDYFEHLFGVSAEDATAQSVLSTKDKTKSFYEDVIQIGDMNDTGCIKNSKAAVIAQKALLAYMNGDEQLGIKSYSERNPNFYIFNAVLHMDEATPHLHIDYIPIGMGYKRGLQVQNSYTKALEGMGFVGSDGFKQWRDKERDIFREICSAYGLDPKSKEDEHSRGHTYTPVQYRQMMLEAEKIKAEAEKLLAEAKATTKLVEAPTEPEKPVEASEPVHRSNKQAGKKKPVEKPVEPVKPITYQNPCEVLKSQLPTAEQLLAEFGINKENDDYDFTK